MNFCEFLPIFANFLHFLAIFTNFLQFFHVFILPILPNSYNLTPESPFSTQKPTSSPKITPKNCNFYLIPDKFSL